MKRYITSGVISLFVVLLAIAVYRYYFPLGKYVYLEHYNRWKNTENVCHAKKDCSMISGDVKWIESEQVKSINTSDWSFCTKCVNDRAYELLNCTW